MEKEKDIKRATEAVGVKITAQVLRLCPSFELLRIQETSLDVTALRSLW